MNAGRLLGFALAILLLGCGRGSEATPKQIETEILANLGTGADAEAIESYLRGRNLPFSYDRFSNRYQSIIRDPNSDAHAITIHISLDANGRFAGVEARDSYTLP